jgi:aryl-alcohol dehydrogenase-like predicted oxidoreductase
MDTRTLGRTGLKVSAVGLGTWALGGPATLGGIQFGWGPVEEAQALATIRAALDAGTTLLDTADVYGWGRSESLVGKALRGRRRESAVLVTKVGNREDAKGEAAKDFSAGWVLPAVEGSLRRLGVDVIDLLLLHSPADTFRYTPEDAEPFEGLKRAGKIRFYGVSVGRYCQGIKVVQAGFGDAVQVVYNLLDRRSEAQIFPLALEKQVGIIARVPLASGFLSGKYGPGQRFAADDWRSRWGPEEVRARAEGAARLAPLAQGRTRVQAALSFCLAHPAVSTVIPGAKSPEQARENAAAVEGPAFSEAERRLIDAVVPPGKDLPIPLAAAP